MEDRILPKSTRVHTTPAGIPTGYIVKVTPILKLNFKEPRMAKAILEKNKIGDPLALEVLSVFENICFVLGRVWMVPLGPTEHIEIFCFALVNFITSSRRCRWASLPRCAPPIGPPCCSIQEKTEAVSSANLLGLGGVTRLWRRARNNTHTEPQGTWVEVWKAFLPTLCRVTCTARGGAGIGSLPKDIRKKPLFSLQTSDWEHFKPALTLIGWSENAHTHLPFNSQANTCHIFPRRSLSLHPYPHTHISTHTGIHVCAHTRIHAPPCVYISAHIRDAYPCVHMYIPMHTFTHARLFAHIIHMQSTHTDSHVCMYP